MIFLPLLFATQVWAADQVALISDARHRNAVLEAQMAAISARNAPTADKSCDVMLAPLPVPQAPGRPVSEATTMPFASATTALEKMVSTIGGYYPNDCVAILLQNLALENPMTATTQRIIAQISNLAPTPGSLATRALACEPPPSGIENILGLARDAESIGRCDPLAPGKWKKVKGRSAHNTTVDYSMVQNAEGVRVVLNIDFRRLNATDPVTEGMMMERARACMQAVSGLIKTPGNQNMEFDLISPAEASRMPSDVRPDPNVVTIEHSPTGGYIRSHAGNYASDVGCPTLVHEVLHLVGLCDEYPGDADGYICRATPVQNNVMADTFEAFTTSVPRTVTCECNTEECRESMALPGRTQFSLQQSFFDVTTPRFRNAYCTSNNNAEWVDWPAASAAPPRNPISTNLSADGNALSVTHYALVQPGDKLGPLAYDCTCPPEDGQCRSFISALSRGEYRVSTKTCPQMMTQTDFIWGRTNQPQGYNNGRLVMTSTPSDIPLLHPIHARRILAGSCMTTTPTYNECASRAYNSTVESCEDTPSHCLSPEPYGPSN